MLESELDPLLLDLFKYTYFLIVITFDLIAIL